MPTRFFGGSWPLGLEFERECGKESGIGGRARCFVCGPGVKSVPETADHLRGKSENADGFRARIEPEGAGSFGTREKLAEAHGFWCQEGAKQGGSDGLGTRAEPETRGHILARVEPEKAVGFATRPNQREPMFSWPRPGRPEDANAFVAKAGPARAEPERSRSSMPVSKRAGSTRAAGPTRAGEKAAGPKRPRLKVRQKSTAGGRHGGIDVAGQEGDGNLVVCLCVLGCVEGEWCGEEG